MRVGVTSNSEIKLNAIKSAYEEFGLSVEVLGYSTNSGVYEQPLGPDTEIGARNRLDDLLKQDPNLDGYISIENGIFLERGLWYDKGFIIYQIPNKNFQKEIYTLPVQFPSEYVQLTSQYGFQTTTVGEIMKREGFIENAKDPHLSITGKSRSEFLKEAFLKLILMSENQA